MSSRPKNLRRRIDSEEDDNGSAVDGDGSAADAKPKDSSSFKIKKAQPPKATKLLSFVEDESEDIQSISSRSTKTDREKSKHLSRVTKSTSSQKLIYSKDRSVSATVIQVSSNVQPRAGEYTAERIQELKKNARTLTCSKSMEPKPLEEPGIVLKGLVKPPDTVSADIHEVKVLQVTDDKSSDLQSRPMNVETMHVSSKAGMGHIVNSSASTIPDRATIDALKAKRERLRHARAAPDYISLDSKGGDLSDDEGDFTGRIALLGEKSDSHARKGVFDCIEDDAVFATNLALSKQPGLDDEEDEEKKWEEEQFRKGLGKRVDDAPRSNGYSVGGSVMGQIVHQQGFSYQTDYSSSVSAIEVTTCMEVMTIAQQAELATRALRDNYERLKESHDKVMYSKNMTNERMVESLKNIDDLENSLSDAKVKCNFMNEMHCFVSVICDFLQDKAPYIEELEEQMQRLHEQRASGIMERRAADNKDEILEVEATFNAMKLGNHMPSRECMNLPVQLDEFGRDLNLQKRMEMTQRAEARKWRQLRADEKRRIALSNSSVDHRIEGESSTDESDSEVNAYSSMRKEIIDVADQVFGDADDEYSKLTLVKKRFSEWKKNYSKSYHEAYMSLNIRAIFSPYVRLELLKWDPLHVKADFNDMNWHSLLFDYGMPENQSEFDPGDMDADLVPELVEKLALPILHHDIAHCWDMLSTKHTRNAVSATNMIINYVPASSAALQDLLGVIHTRLANAVSNLIVPTWDNLVIRTVPDASRIAAYRFGVSIRLMKNICIWKDILALPVLEELVLDELLIGKILPHIRGILPNTHDAITRTERVIMSLSGVWSGPRITGKQSSKLLPLVEYVMTLGSVLEKKHKMGLEEASGLARRLKKMLVELNEYERARSILKMFNLKEAL